MANFFSNIFSDPNDNGKRKQIDSTFDGARNRTSTAAVIVPVAAVNADEMFMVKLPSHCILKPSSTLYFPVISAGAAVSIGDDAFPAALNASVVMTAAGNESIIADIAETNYDQRLWQMLGWATDPAKLLNIKLTWTVAPGNGADAKIVGVFDFLLD